VTLKLTGQDADTGMFGPITSLCVVK